MIVASVDHLDSIDLAEGTAATLRCRCTIPWLRSALQDGDVLCSRPPSPVSIPSLHAMQVSGRSVPDSTGVDMRTGMTPQHRRLS